MKPTLRGILDLFENAGFVITYYSHYDRPECSGVFKIALKSGAIKDVVTEYEKEQANAARICALLEQNNFQPLRFDTGTGVISDYAGTVYIEFEKIPGSAEATT
jgi:hypothetical protein